MDTGLTLGTVNIATVTAVHVVPDGSTTSMLAVVPGDLQGRLMVPGGVGARVIGTRLGTRFYVTDILSGGGPVEWNFEATAVGGLLDVTLGSVTWPAGVVTVVGQGSGSNSGPGFATGFIDMGIDGVRIDPTVVMAFGFNQVNVHKTLPLFQGRAAITAGTHTIQALLIAVANGDDWFGCRVTWAPV